MTRKRKAPSLGITEADIMSELAELAGKPDPRRRSWTALEDAALWRARGPQQKDGRKVPWSDFLAWFHQRFGYVAESTVRARLAYLEQQGGPKR